MSFEYIVEKDNSVKKLSATDESQIVKIIADSFVNFNEKRASNLEKSNNLINEIFFQKNNINKSSDKNINWKSKIKMCKLFMFYHIYNM